MALLVQKIVEKKIRFGYFKPREGGLKALVDCPLKRNFFATSLNYWPYYGENTYSRVFNWKDSQFYSNVVLNFLNIPFKNDRFFFRIIYIDIIVTKINVHLSKSKTHFCKSIR